MSRLSWNTAGTRLYETGIDRGVLYIDDDPGVVWNGITAVEESPSGGDPQGYYQDGIRYMNVPAPEEFEATLTAFYSPEEFDLCDGTKVLRDGFFVRQQPRRPFGLSYRTKIGNDLEGSKHGYKIHILHNLLATPSSRNYNTQDDSVEIEPLSWSLTAKPLVLSGMRASAHFIIDSTHIPPETLVEVENLLYGSDTSYPTLPTPQQILDIYGTEGSLLELIDHGDGTFTVRGPEENVRDYGNTFRLNGNEITEIDQNRFTITVS